MPATSTSERYAKLFGARSIPLKHLQVMVIPRLEQRLNCMITRKRFDLDLEELRPELAILRNAADEIRHSNKFKRVLKVSALG